MLTITIPGVEMFDEQKQRFKYTEPVKLVLQHSLVSLSKWEEQFEKPFLSKEKKTTEETYAYIKAMCVKGKVTENVLLRLSDENLKEINQYIEAKHSATWFNETPGRAPSREIITAEIIYHWMFALQIPKECENWHLNRLLTQIKVVNEKSKPPKKGGRPDLAARRALNEQRLREQGTTG